MIGYIFDIKNLTDDTNKTYSGINNFFRNGNNFKNFNTGEHNKKIFFSKCISFLKLDDKLNKNIKDFSENINYMVILTNLLFYKFAFLIDKQHMKNIEINNIEVDNIEVNNIEAKKLLDNYAQKFYKTANKYIDKNNIAKNNHLEQILLPMISFIENKTQLFDITSINLFNIQYIGKSNKSLHTYNSYISNIQENYIEFEDIKYFIEILTKSINEYLLRNKNDLLHTKDNIILFYTLYIIRIIIVKSNEQDEQYFLFKFNGGEEFGVMDLFDYLCNYFIENNIYTYNKILNDNKITGPNLPLFILSIFILYDITKKYYPINKINNIRDAFFNDNNKFNNTDLLLINVEILDIFSNELPIKLLNKEDYNNNNDILKNTLNDRLILLLSPFIELNYGDKNYLLFKKNYLNNNNKDVFYTKSKNIQ